MSGSMVISLTLIFESDAKIIKNVIGWARQRKYFIRRILNFIDKYHSFSMMRF